MNRNVTRWVPIALCGLICIAVLSGQDDPPSHFDDLKNATVPIGGVIPYFGDLQRLPDNWRLCDGAPLPDDADPGLMRVLGGNLPDLQGRFLRGADDQYAAGKTGGKTQDTQSFTTDQRGAHTHTVAAHTHSLPDQTSIISNIGGEPGSRPYKVTDNGPDSWNNAHLVAHGGGGGLEGNHRHDLGGSTGSASPATSEQGAHTHSVGVTIDTVPPFTAQHFVMRIR